MTQIFPTVDEFVEEATPYGDRHVGYARHVPWATDAGSGDAIVVAAGNLSTGYLTAGTSGGFQAFGSSARRASVFNASGTASAVSCFLWRQFYAGRATSKLAFMWQKLPGTATVADFRYAMVGTRVSGQSIVDTAGSEHLADGDGYWLVARNAASQPGFKFMLLRVNAGVTTKLAETTLVNVGTVVTGTGVWMSIVASTSGATVVLSCKRGSIGREAVDGNTSYDVFGGNVIDSDASRLTAAGRVGFGLSKPPVGSAPLAMWYEAIDALTATVVLRDEWDRVNYLVGASVGPDANGKSGLNLIPLTGADVGSSAIVQTLMIARDPGNDQGKNTTGATAFDAVNAIAASHYATQRRSALVTFNTLAPGVEERFKIDLRGTLLASSTLSCYRVELHTIIGPVFICNVYSLVGGVATVIATKSLAGVGTGTAIEFDVYIQNIGGATAFDGDPNIIVSIDGTPQTGWTTTLLPAQIEIQANGTIVDHRSSAIRQGWEQAYRYVHIGGTPVVFIVDEWTDVVDAQGVNDLASIAVSGETDGVTGTLTLPISFNIEEVHRRPGVHHRYESDHRQSIALGSRDRRRWKVSRPAMTAVESTALLTFFDAHDGVEIPFNWVNPDGEATIGRWVVPGVERRLRATGVDSFDEEILELFVS